MREPITVILILMFAFGLIIIAALHIDTIDIKNNRIHQIKVEVCSPYSYKTSFKEKDKTFVVCGNKEIREIDIKIEKE